MTSLSIAGLLAGLSLAAPSVHAAPEQLQGSDTMFDVEDPILEANGFVTCLASGCP